MVEEDEEAFELKMEVEVVDVVEMEMVELKLEVEVVDVDQVDRVEVRVRQSRARRAQRARKVSNLTESFT